MTTITPKTFVDKPSGPLLQAIREQLVAKRWYIHLLLWIVVLFMGFPLFYAALISTQSNAQMFRLQLTPGDSFAINLEAVLDRNIARLMFNTFAVAIYGYFWESSSIDLQWYGTGLLPLSRQISLSSALSSSH